MEKIKHFYIETNTGEYIAVKGFTACPHKGVAIEGWDGNKYHSRWLRAEGDCNCLQEKDKKIANLRVTVAVLQAWIVIELVIQFINHFLL